MPSQAAETNAPASQAGVEGVPVGPDCRPLRQARRTGRLEQLESQVSQLLERMNIAVIYGGDKSVEGAVINQTQNPRSWKSYQAVAQDIADALIRLGAKSVSLMPDDMTLGDRLRQDNIHFAWLNTGGVQGYDSMSHCAAMLEMIGIPYVGHHPLTAGILDNKHTFKRQLNALRIPTADFMTWHELRDEHDFVNGRQFKEVFADYPGPYVVKPVCGRASLHVNIVDTTAELMDCVAEVYQATENHVLIEKFLPGKEYTVAVCGSIIAQGKNLIQLKEPLVFSPIERVLLPDEKIFTSMDLRPITKDRLRLLGSDSDPDVYEKLVEIAQEVFTQMDLETLIRLDLRMDVDGRFNVLEANPKPDLKRPTGDKTSIVCAGLQAVGMDYDDLIFSLLVDQIDFLFCQRRGTVTTLSALLD